MESSKLLRHQVIKNNVAQHAEKGADDVIVLWEKLATNIISIVGQGGFNSLFARAIFLSQATFPWLTIDARLAQNDQRFAELRTSLEGQSPAKESAANNLLLITFTDVLASLIGEMLTFDIIRSAWGNYESDEVDKERKNE